ncbi:hypothetical protein O6H91_09G056400 [Diphasiastrum complanatum]|uniref:Uncharacterized protein n=1 Tax=Diphasiastrum complanatum TaxID=34168 RepID=A0ACC2CPJ6_DIPCM|nr:hypothetical protein O6H91_09G056400 [Diphasiastrum complanatum]
MSLVFGGFLVLVILELYQLVCCKRTFSSSILISVFQNPVRFRRDRTLGFMHDVEAATESEEKLYPVEGERPILSDDLQMDHLLAPSRLLFTIKEETKDEMESDEGRSKGPSWRNSLESNDFLPELPSDSITLLETPFVTAPASPIYTPPLSPPTISSFSCPMPSLHPH